MTRWMTAVLMALSACAAGADGFEEPAGAHEAPVLAQEAKQRVSPVPASVLNCPSRRIALRTWSGYWVSAENGGGGAVNADRIVLGPWETFEYEAVEGNKIALKTLDGHYLTAANGGGGGLEADRKKRGPWETFFLTLMSFKHDSAETAQTGFALYTSEGGRRYWSAVDGGGGSLTVDRTTPSLWETFQVLCR